MKEALPCPPTLEREVNYGACSVVPRLFSLLPSVSREDWGYTNYPGPAFGRYNSLGGLLGLLLEAASLGLGVFEGLGECCIHRSQERRNREEETLYDWHSMARYFTIQTLEG